ncbi:HD domain-containing protein [Nonlabens xiamenensis]|uniref:HD domain-containing protein n=1 Tax=Nonlabens xiamenensis TaxID=2341043 RepID=UPI000F60CEF0|nr:hypothetical protein [Nonlabens xiamenensis]
MKEKFLSLIERYSSDKDYKVECWNELNKKYSSKSRHYHNLDHLDHMFSELEKVKSEINRLDAIEFSIFYHDLIYNPRKSDSEYQSALVFKKRLSNTSFTPIDYCVEQIVATKEHKLSDDSDTNLLLDMDLSILGSEPDRYQGYAKKIRKEYAIYPGWMYRKGRKKVLQHFLSLDSIFKTEFFRNEYEEKARENLENELRELGELKA